ncbi:GTP-binding protein 10 [Perkinsus chesapeaki]|uniref:Cilia-and flagella-associated protein 96 n=1 Tax=Perkinsus chesapeaki TaxID=330153 RepID=A0A7J6M121_PERCH|nr:GTP-binding protein 10 [Perkinsus chesapeaki]
MGRPKESLDEKRARIYEDTLAETNKPRFGYFGYAPPLCIGEDNAFKTTKRKPKTDEELPNFGRNALTNPPKKGSGVDALFSFPEPLCNGDLYVDPGRRLGRDKGKSVDPEAQFKPAGAVKVPPSAYEYVEQQTGIEGGYIGIEGGYIGIDGGRSDPKALYEKYKDYTYPRNFVTSPAKVGGGGVLTPGVLFTPVAEHVSDDYDAMRKMKFEEMKRNREKLGEQMPFRVGACNDTSKTFQKNSELYHCEQPYGIPRPLSKPNVARAQHEMPFRPTNPSKKGHQSTMSPFPEHVPERPVEARRRPKSEEETGPPPWKPNSTSRMPANPMPSVVMNTRNLKASFPSAFARLLSPAIGGPSNTFVYPPTFYVSTLAYDPATPEALSTITVILEPSETLTSTPSSVLSLHVHLPGFGCVGDTRTAGNCEAWYGDIPGSSIPDVCSAAADPFHKLITITPPSTVEYLPEFSPFVYCDTDPTSPTEDRVILEIDTLPAAQKTEFNLCCFYLPTSSPLNNPALTVRIPTSTPEVKMEAQPIKNSPEIDRGNYWQLLQKLPKAAFVAEFRIIVRSATDAVFGKNPLPELATKERSMMTIAVRPAQSLSNQAKIIVYLDEITRDPAETSNTLLFSTPGDDWTLFEYFAAWDQDLRSLTFSLRAGVTLRGGRKVSFTTQPGEFVLPREVQANNQRFKVEARSRDQVDELIPRTGVFQSDYVPGVRTFSVSTLSYSSLTPYAIVDVEFTFICSRPLFNGDSIFLKLPGFQTSETTVPLFGAVADYFRESAGRFDLPSNELRLEVNKTIYFSGAEALLLNPEAVPGQDIPITVGMRNLKLPGALYQNDPSLLLWNSDKMSTPQSVQTSPRVGEFLENGEVKEFLVSELSFSPTEPDNPSSVTLRLRPSVFLYQQNRVILHLYGFKLTSGVTTPEVSSLPLEDTVEAANFVNKAAEWNSTDSTLSLTVANERVIRNDVDTVVTVPWETGLKLPSKLSENDGLLTIEALGTYIKKESIKMVPAIGPPKYITDSRLLFDPAEANAQSRIEFEFTANSDILPGTRIHFKLGGMERVLSGGGNPSGLVQLSGMNAPLFDNSQGSWDNGGQLLTVVVDAVTILAGRQTSFFIEQDQGFVLPYAMYQTDPSLYMYIPEAGIPSAGTQAFNFTSRVNRAVKTFVVSELGYGVGNEVPYPNTISTILITLRPNVVLPQGSVIRLHLPGFQCQNSQPLLSPPTTNVLDPGYKRFLTADGVSYYGTWNASHETLDLEVSPGQKVPNNALTIVRLDAASAALRLPPRMAENDERLKIEVTAGQMIFPEPIKISPMVVPRTFDISKFVYEPREALRTFKMLITLMPTVTITEESPVIIKLLEFQNIDRETQNIYLTGKHAHLVEDATALWDQQAMELTLRVAPGRTLPEFTEAQFQIEESQGFILPRSLYKNDPRLTIRSVGNILEEPVKDSPLVGDGPYDEQQYCVYQFERGIRYHIINEAKYSTNVNRQCLSEPMCDPWITDPCSRRELDRCVCPDLYEEASDLTISGFNLYDDDRVVVVDEDDECTADVETRMSPAWSIPEPPTVNEVKTQLNFAGVRATETGHFRICVLHFGEVFNVGRIVVRPSCEAPSVMVQGTCMKYCPSLNVPVAGECVVEPTVTASETGLMPITPHEEEDQALMVSIRMKYPAADSKRLFNLSADDPSRDYFNYRFTYELADILDVDPTRFQMELISRGSTPTQADRVIVSVVLKPAPKTVVEVRADEKERSPLALYYLLKALLEDTSSLLYDNEFFDTVDRTYPLGPVYVKLCGGDQRYRVLCPLVPLGLSSATAEFYFFGAVVLTTISLVLLCTCVWRLDLDAPAKTGKGKRATYRVTNVSSGDLGYLDPSMRSEFARSWLEGRLMDDEATVRRREKRAQQKREEKAKAAAPS